MKSSPQVLLGALLALLAAGPAAAGVKAWLDSTTAAPGDSVRLTLDHDGQTRSQPDLSPLSKDFDILGTSSTSNLRIINGQTSSTTAVQITLSPKHAGAIVIPPLTWDGSQSAPLTLNVSAGGAGQGTAAGTAAGGSRVFIETEVEPKNPYVLSAVHLTVRVYEAVQLYREGLELPGSDAAVVRQLGADQTSTADKNGVSYVVRTRRYLLFPQRSGTLSLPGATLNALVEASSPRSDPYDPFAGFGGMVRNVRPIRVHGDAITLDVQPRPAAASAPYWLPARNVSLEATWEPQSLEAHVGDPITVDLVIRAQDLAAAQLPDLSKLLSIPGTLRAYPEQPKLKDTDQGDGVEGSREQSVALLADQPGHYSIPALHVSWWNTQTHQPQELTVPARTLVVLPAAGAPAAPAPVAGTAASAPQAGGPSPASANPTPPQGASQPGPRASALWPAISAGLLALWLATLGAWLWSRRHRAAAGTPPTPASPDAPASASRERAAFQEACRRNDAPAARRHLLAWAAAQLGADAPAGLAALARRLDDPALTGELQALDRACYAGGTSSSWNGEVLGRRLTALPAGPAASRPAGLAPLYP